MILHVFPREKFTSEYIKFINENFNADEHEFYIIGGSKKYDICKYSNVKSFDQNKIKFLISLYKSKKIIFHSLINKKCIYLLFFQPWLSKKSYWAVWGADLYWNEYRKDNVYEMMRRSVIKKIYGIVTHIYGDYKLAKKWYGCKAKYYQCFLYLSNVFKEYDESTKIDTDKICIQIGNSADPTNNHIEILDKLKKFSHKDIEIICPLSYGNESYREKVISYGKDIFGDKFIPITEFLSFDKYIQILSKVSIAIFNHRRQQAVGNIISLIGMGKKVYIRDSITTWDFAKQYGLKVYSIENEFDSLLEKMDVQVVEDNKNLIRKNFSKSKLKEGWKKVFLD